MSFNKLPVIAAVAAFCLATAPAALAGPRGGGGKPPKPPTGGGTISAPILLDSTDGLAHWGQRVTFTVYTNATTEPWVHLKCYQNGTLVSQGSEGFFTRSIDDGIFSLYSPAWTGGDADCTATLTTPSKTALAATSFHVYP